MVKKNKSNTFFKIKYNYFQLGDLVFFLRKISIIVSFVPINLDFLFRFEEIVLKNDMQFLFEY